MNAARRELIRELRERTRRLETAAQRPEAGAAAPVALGELLLGRGFPRGALVEWPGEGEGSGAVSLALAVAGQILPSGGALMVIDGPGEFYPPALVGLGVALEQTIIVRPPDARTGLWAWEQALRCGAAAVTLGQIDESIDRHVHRLQLAAEAGGGLGFLLRPAGMSAAAAKAAIRLHVTGQVGPGPLHAIDRRLRVELLHCRGGQAGETAELELGDATNPVRLVSELGGAAKTKRVAWG
jgi:protein ImuA